MKRIADVVASRGLSLTGLLLIAASCQTVPKESSQQLALNRYCDSGAIAGINVSSPLESRLKSLLPEMSAVQQCRFAATDRGSGVRVYVLDRDPEHWFDLPAYGAVYDRDRDAIFLDGVMVHKYLDCPEDWQVENYLVFVLCHELAHATLHRETLAALQLRTAHTPNASWNDKHQLEYEADDYATRAFMSRRDVNKPTLVTYMYNLGEWAFLEILSHLEGYDPTDVAATHPSMVQRLSSFYAVAAESEGLSDNDRGLLRGHSTIMTELDDTLHNNVEYVAELPRDHTGTVVYSVGDRVYAVDDKGAVFKCDTPPVGKKWVQMTGPLPGMHFTDEVDPWLIVDEASSTVFEVDQVKCIVHPHSEATGDAPTWPAFNEPFEYQVRCGMELRAIRIDEDSGSLVLLARSMQDPAERKLAAISLQAIGLSKNDDDELVLHGNEVVDDMVVGTEILAISTHTSSSAADSSWSSSWWSYRWTAPSDIQLVAMYDTRSTYMRFEPTRNNFVSAMVPVDSSGPRPISLRVLAPTGRVDLMADVPQIGFLREFTGEYLDLDIQALEGGGWVLNEDTFAVVDSHLNVEVLDGYLGGGFIYQSRGNILTMPWARFVLVLRASNGR